MQPIVELIESFVPVSYSHALEVMQKRVSDIQSGAAPSALWLLEHNHMYSAGTGANDNELLVKDKHPVYQTGRGGKYTYHGPGQRVAYVMLDIKQVHNQAPDLKKFVSQLETWIINTLSDFRIVGETRNGRIGIWVKNTDGTEDKIAAIGIRVQKWISFHGVAININTKLDEYNGIIPCGISEHGVTSLQKMGVSVSMEDFDNSLKKHFAKVFQIEYL